MTVTGQVSAFCYRALHVSEGRVQKVHKHCQAGTEILPMLNRLSRVISFLPLTAQ